MNRQLYFMIYEHVHYEKKIIVFLLTTFALLIMTLNAETAESDSLDKRYEKLESGFLILMESATSQPEESLLARNVLEESRDRRILPRLRVLSEMLSQKRYADAQEEFSTLERDLVILQNLLDGRSDSNNIKKYNQLKQLSNSIDQLAKSQKNLQEQTKETTKHSELAREQEKLSQRTAQLSINEENNKSKNTKAEESLYQELLKASESMKESSAYLTKKENNNAETKQNESLAHLNQAQRRTKELMEQEKQRLADSAMKEILAALRLQAGNHERITVSLPPDISPQGKIQNDARAATSQLLKEMEGLVTIAKAGQLSPTQIVSLSLLRDDIRGNLDSISRNPPTSAIHSLYKLTDEVFRDTIQAFERSQVEKPKEQNENDHAKGEKNENGEGDSAKKPNIPDRETLSMIRTMQSQLNRKIKIYERIRQEGDETTDIKTKLEELAQRQEKILILLTGEKE